MPVEQRATDTYTRDNLLLGFSQVYFTPLQSGVYGTEVPLGILSTQELQKTIETLELERGDSGLITVDRELISKLTAAFQFQTFNLRKDIAQYVFASSQGSPAYDVTADAAAVVTNEPFNIPSSNPFDSFVSLNHGAIDETSLEVSCGVISSEAIGTGNGVLGASQGDFALNYKIKAIVDVATFFVAAVDFVAAGKIVAGSTPAADEVAIEIALEDSIVTGSGAITFGASVIPAAGAAIVATYTPSFSTTGTDIVNLTDFVFDPTLGKIRMLHAGADASPFRLTGDSQPLEIDYTYARKAHVVLKPFTQTVFEGKASIKHIPDVGVNFIWTIPSASIRLTDDALTFDAADFATATLILNILDAGGTERFGSLNLSSETEANA
jgi:hypothetical protein